MKSRAFKSIFLSLFLILVPLGVVIGQGEDPNRPTTLPGQSGSAAEFPDKTDPGTEGIAAPEMILSQPPYTMNYQGYLTDSSGQPINGAYTMNFWLYDDATAGNLVWGPEAHNNVGVNKGLFSVVLGETIALTPNYFDRALFLAVEVNGVQMPGRQPLRSVSYAYGLVPGAKVKGDPQGTNYTLSVENTGVGVNDRGLYVTGSEYAIYAQELGVGNISIYTPDFIQAGGYKSNADSYLWLPAIGGVVASGSTGLNIETWWFGRIRFSSSTNETDYYYYLPIDTPSLLFGEAVTIEELTVFYYTNDQNSYIDNTGLYMMAGADDGSILINDGTNRTSTTSTSYSLVPTGNYILDGNAGALIVQLEFHFASTAHSIYIGGIRLRLGHAN